MTWLTDLITGQGTAHAIFVLALVITIGLALSSWKIAGLTFGSAWILFVGIFLAHCGLVIDGHTLYFVRELGLALFVFSIGLQVGPSFLSALRKGGLILNLLATGMVALGVAVTVAVYYATDISGPTLVGIMSGAVTNTPGLGAAQETYRDMTGRGDPTIASGYAVAYPLAVVGIILSMIVLRAVLNVDLRSAERELNELIGGSDNDARKFTIKVTNAEIIGKSVTAVTKMLPTHFVISRVKRAGSDLIELVEPSTTFADGDELLVIAQRADRDLLTAVLGHRVDVPAEQWLEGPAIYEARQMVLSTPKLNGVAVSKLNLRSVHGVTITRVHRGGTDLVASPRLQLVLGDRLTVVGTAENLSRVEKLCGNSARSLDAPNLFVLFSGLVLGVLLGSIPLTIPGVPVPVKLGLAGGPLVVALLLGRFGPQLRLVTYSTVSANLMLRELGMALFLAGVGLSAGPTFVATVMQGGYLWVLWGLLITVVPVLIIGAIGATLTGVNFLVMIGVLAGASTDPPALAYAQSLSTSDGPAIGYASVYPLTMFLRVVAAQVLVILLV
ncbi:putative transport protein YidE [Austwickia sp. TVS 96-490-7B]|uniref:putative transporter n=1 Tax=Austwickia sp. TVS 96-490-7B TaxID=2830843 RepID=UPI001C598CE2|nr:putative transporter [Austwickia sp. TVS 96-490-7B]MBW3085414.1 putative transport protein YidE [Austwickia sp. TVS 96-490-7B]